MKRLQLKRGVFLLEALNSISTTFYFYYLFFYMQSRYHFGNKENLWLASGIGLVYGISAMFGGKFGQRKGYFFAIKLGAMIMAASLFLGAFEWGLGAHLACTALCSFGMCFTWPNLEAATSHDEPEGRMQWMLGVYNLVWAFGGAITYFCGGAMLEKLGMKSLFLVPAAIQTVHSFTAMCMQKQARLTLGGHYEAKPIALDLNHTEERRRTSLLPRTFRTLAWVANPLAYVAINSAAPLIPTIARKLDLSPMLAGFFCSVWFFARAFSFFILWQWTGWHYRFRWLITGYLGIVLGFSALLLASSVAVLLVAQIVFGTSLGLIYYSSLYYSMDNSDTKAEHGGFHEAVIGAGNCLGPALGAAAITLFPRQAHIGVYAVSASLTGGFFWLLAIANKGKRRI